MAMTCTLNQVVDCNEPFLSANLILARLVFIWFHRTFPALQNGTKNIKEKSLTTWSNPKDAILKVRIKKTEEKMSKLKRSKNNVWRKASKEKMSN
jgi:hypothetical protein